MKMVEKDLFVEPLNEIPCNMEIKEIEESIQFQIYEPFKRIQQALDMIRQDERDEVTE